MLRDDEWHGKGNHYKTLFRQYELRGHTGNVLATITDRKLPHDPDNDTLTDYYTTDMALYK